MRTLIVVIAKGLAILAIAASTYGYAKFAYRRGELGDPFPAVLTISIVAAILASTVVLLLNARNARRVIVVAAFALCGAFLGVTVLSDPGEPCFETAEDQNRLLFGPLGAIVGGIVAWMILSARAAANASLQPTGSRQKRPPQPSSEGEGDCRD
jgi:hypothetical protein